MNSIIRRAMFQAGIEEMPTPKEIVTAVKILRRLQERLRYEIGATDSAKCAACGTTHGDMERSALMVKLLDAVAQLENSR
jgi:hypothetical protein